MKSAPKSRSHSKEFPKRKEYIARICNDGAAAPTGFTKAGLSLGNQTYRCGECLHQFTPEGNRNYYPEAIKRQEPEAKPHSCSCWSACGALQDRYMRVVCLSVNERRMGKGGVMDRNEGRALGIARQVEQACAAYKDLLQGGWNADLAACAGVAEVGLDLTCLHLLGMTIRHRRCVGAQALRCGL